MVKCPNCGNSMTLHEKMNGGLEWVCYKCGRIGLSMGYKITY